VQRRAIGACHQPPLGIEGEVREGDYHTPLSVRPGPSSRS
jgi:hypothetical protein